VAANGNSIAFTNDTHDTAPTWENIDAYVVSFFTRRGRASEFTKTEAGEAGWEVNDRLGDFDPTNTSGAFYPNVDALKQAKINVKHPIAGTYHDVFTGYVDEYEYARLGARAAHTTIPLTDGFEVLEQGNPAVVAGGIFYAVQHVDDRIKAAAADVDWPLTRTRVATGNVNLQGMTYDADTSALTIMQEAADGEFPGVANLFIDAAGNLAFSGRGIRFDPTSFPDWITTWRVGDEAACALDPTLLPIARDGLVLSRSKEFLYNRVVAAPRNADPATIFASQVSDAISIGKYGVRSLSLLDLLTLNGTTSGLTGVQETQQMALYYKNNYAVPLTRVKSIEFHGQMDDGTTTPGGASGNLWNFILGVELNHIVEVNTVHPGGGGLVAVDYFVEGIENDATRLNDVVPNWKMNLDLSPRARYATYP
jgi:hypothetical protein